MRQSAAGIPPLPGRGRWGDPGRRSPSGSLALGYYVAALQAGRAVQFDMRKRASGVRVASEARHRFSARGQAQRGPVLPGSTVPILTTEDTEMHRENSGSVNSVLSVVKNSPRTDPRSVGRLAALVVLRRRSGVALRLPPRYRGRPGNSPKPQPSRPDSACFAASREIHHGFSKSSLTPRPKDPKLKYSHLWVSGSWREA